MAKTRPPYTPEFRRQMVELVRAGRSPEELAQEFEPTAQSIRNWVGQAECDAGHGGNGLTTAEREELAQLSIPAIPISRSRRSRSPIPIDPDQCGAGCVRAPLDAFPDLSIAFRCQVRREPVPVVNRRDPRATRSAPMRRVAACAGGAC